jgi:hypothetical protein
MQVISDGIRSVIYATLISSNTLCSPHRDTHITTKILQIPKEVSDVNPIIVSNFYTVNFLGPHLRVLGYYREGGFSH